jgi:hypothetical protein
MNEQIKELVRQAGGIEHDNDGNELTPILVGTSLEKFAELLVKDIINVLESKNEIRHIALTTYDSSIVEGTIEKSINAITEHYGMKQHHRIKNERIMGRKVSSL